MKNKLLKQLSNSFDKAIKEATSLYLDAIKEHTSFHNKASKQIKKYDWKSITDSLSKITNTICSNAYKVSDLKITMDNKYNDTVVFYIKGILHYPKINSLTKEVEYEPINQSWYLDGGINTINQYKSSNTRDLPNIIKYK